MNAYKTGGSGSGGRATEDWRRRIEQAVTRAEGLLVEIPPDHWNRTPANLQEDWTAAQHIEHLCVVTSLVADKVEEALGKSPPSGNPDRWNPGWFSRLFIAACGPQPPGRATPAPPLFLPGAGPFETKDLRDRFVASHARFLDLISRCENVDIARLTAPSAAMPFIRVSLGTWFEAMSVHTPYHVSRAETLLETGM